MSFHAFGQRFQPFMFIDTPLQKPDNILKSYL